MTAAHDVREAWLGLAAARRRCGDPAGAAAALGRALSGHVLDPGMTGLADAVAREAGAAGWCGWSPDGGPVASAPDAVFDPRPWDGADRLSIAAGGAPLIGSPLRLDALRRVEGVVAGERGGLGGWAWHPGDPDRDPVLTVEDRAGRRVVVTAGDQDVRAAAGRLLARPRAIRLTEAELAGLRPPLRILGSDGRDLLGSPLDPWAGRRAARAAARAVGRAFATAPPAPPFASIPVGDRPARPPAARPAKARPAAIVIPVHGGGALTRACLDAVLAARGRGRGAERVIVIDDASPDPALSAHLRALAAARRITLIVNARNRGFPAGANAGIRAAGRRDVVLLNSDALVPPGWLAALQAAAYAAPDIGTASPLSNDATILSYPKLGSVCPDAAGVARTARLAARANGAAVADVPVTVGFCMYLRRDCLDEAGLLREDAFAQGYGEENDLCLRARALGWRHVAALGAYVGHAGGASFGAARAHLLERNGAVLERLHPGYGALIAEFAAADPLAEARRRMDALRWRGGARVPARAAGAVILITHDEAGGVERQAAAHCRALAAEGRRAVVLRPVRLPGGCRGVEVCEGAERGFPNLRFAVPGELDALTRLLRGDRPALVSIHHMLGQDWALAGLHERLGAELEVRIHDYALMCPRVTLVDRDRRYCGAPEARICDACVADGGRAVPDELPVGEYRERSALLLAGAARVVAPSQDAASRFARRFPDARIVAEPHEDDAALPPAPARRPSGSRVGVCVVGALGVEKGLDVLVDAARDAAWRGLPLDFRLVGYSTDDRRLADAGVRVTGAFRAAEAQALIAAQGADVALLPSIWPETWCFALTDCWRAGLPVVAFDIGAPAERIRATGRGALVRLGASPAELNAALLLAAGRPAP